MNAEEAFTLFNELAIAKTNTSLDEIERDVFIGIWEGKTYPQIQKGLNYSDFYPKEVGSKLFKKIKANWKINVNKKNFKPTIELLLQKHLEGQENFVPQPTVIQVDSVQYERIPDSYKSEITNPFFHTNVTVDDPRFFFNRDKEIDQVFDWLNSSSSVVLIGEDYIGKSSLLRAIEREAASRLNLYRQPLYLDLSHIYDEDDFYGALCDFIGIELTKGRLLERALRNYRILLLLDEVEKMTWDCFTNNLRLQLRRLANGINPPLRFVIATSKPLDVLFPDDGGKLSPFQNICHDVIIGPWNEKTMRAFITSRLASPWLKPEVKFVSFTEEEIARVVAESRGHPQKLMQLCYDIYKNYLEE